MEHLGKSISWNLPQHTDSPLNIARFLFRNAWEMSSRRPREAAEEIKGMKISKRSHSWKDARKLKD